MMTDPILELENFLPYRLSVLANRVSRAFARLYEKKFALKLPEWRVMAVLGRQPGVTASTVTEMTAMDKVAISRALARLQEMGRVEAREDEVDRRKQKLFLSPQGLEIYRQIVPLAKRIEAELLSALTEADRQAIDRLIGHLMEKAATIDQ